MAVAKLLRRPRPGRVFYGWYIVGAAVIAQFVAVSAQSTALAVFLKPMSSDLGWSRGEYAGAQTAGTVVMGVLGLLIGGVLDRHGARRLMLIGAVLCGSCMVALSRVENIPQFYLLRGIGVTAGAVGIGNLVVNVTVSKWFVRRRGIAVAIAAMGVSLSAVVLPPLLQALIDRFGWRESWVILGVSTWLITIPTAFIMRRTPEDYGLLPDGDVPESTSQGPAAQRRGAATEVSWTRPEAIRTTSIWLLILAYGVANVGPGALLFHLISFLSDSGLSPGVAALLFSVEAWGALIAKPVWGLLMGRYHPRYLSSISFVMAGLSVVGLLVGADHHSVPLLIVMLFLWGLGIGGSIPLQETVWASYYGRLHLGKIRAVAMPFTILFSAMGPLFAARLYDQYGNYTAAFLTFASFWAIGAVLVVLARPPKRRQTASLALQPPPEPSAT